MKIIETIKSFFNTPKINQVTPEQLVKIRLGVESVRKRIRNERSELKDVYGATDSDISFMANACFNLKK